MVEDRVSFSMGGVWVARVQQTKEEIVAISLFSFGLNKTLQRGFLSQSCNVPKRMMDMTEQSCFSYKSIFVDVPMIVGDLNVALLY